MQSFSKKQQYVKINEVGAGTFGIVYKAKDVQTNAIVAVKRLKMGDNKEGVNFGTIREIKMLQELKHEYILKMIDVFVHKHNFHIVYEYCPYDMEKLIKSPTVVLSSSDIKAYMQMILEAVDFCHKNWVLHRDLKPSNLLIAEDENGNVAVKLGDFGLAKFYGSPQRQHSPNAITRWYRPPEMLYGANLYGASVDIWSIGCIFAELMLRIPLLPGDSDMDQLGKIFACLGTPSEKEWPEMKSLPDFVEYEAFPATSFKQIFSAASDDAVDLISKMLVCDPAKRISASDALKHPYFSNNPKPTPKNKLPKPIPPPEKNYKEITTGDRNVRRKLDW